MAQNLSVTEMFNEMVRLGQLTPVERMEDMRFPGELNHVTTYATYGTQVPNALGGNKSHAELDKRP